MTLKGPGIPPKGKGLALQVVRLVDLHKGGNGFSQVYVSAKGCIE